MNHTAALENCARFFASGVTKPYAFRHQALQNLRSAILQHEEALYTALATDLKKSREETWITETGMVLQEIKHCLKNLKSWMAPQKVPTNLLNLPSRSFIYKEPLGVVLIIGPWNYPFQLLFMPLVGAVAAGNCVVLKPSELAPATAAVMKTIVTAAFDSQHVLYIEGEGATVVPQLTANFRFDHIFYTGSTAVGKLIYKMAAETLTPVTLELGGKSPCVVEKDADLKIAARRIAVTKFSNAGQMCVAPDYVLVHESVEEKFIAALKETITQFYTADAATSDSYGKIINEKQFNRLLAYLQQGTVVHGGRYNKEQHFIEPTLLTGVNEDAAVLGEEIFGPLLPVLSFKNFEEGKAIIAKNPNPLAFYVFTNSAEKEKAWLEGVAFGGGCVNNAAWHLTNHNLPFGGRGASGIGAYHGKHSFLLFSHHKSIMKTPTWFDPAIKYPPFKGKLNLFKKVVG